MIGAIVGEWIGSNQGLGAVIIQSTFNYQAERLFAAVVLASFSGIVFLPLLPKSSGLSVGCSRGRAESVQFGQHISMTSALPGQTGDA